MSSLNYRTLSSTDQDEAGAARSVTVNSDGFASTSLQPYIADDSVDKLDEDDPFYQSIESYNKNDNRRSSHNYNRIISSQSAPTTPTRRSARPLGSSSPIPVLLRSASSMLSQSMKLPPGSLRASTFTVITGMVGGGTFTFSYGVYKSGLFPALFYLALIASLAGYTTHSIVYCAEKNNCPSYRSLAKRLFGPRFAIFMQICLVLLLWMVCISYMTLTRNLLSQSVTSLTSGSGHWYDNGIFLLVMASIVPTYLALKRRVSALRYASLFGLIVVICSTSLVVVTYFNWCSGGHSSDHTSEGRKCLVDSVSNHDDWFNTHLLDHSYTIALFFGGFAAQFTILPIYFEMQKRSPQNMTKCIGSGFGFTFCIYCCVAYFGYWTFPNLSDPKNDQNLINLYHDYVPMLVAQILLALYVMSIIPLFAHAFRKSLSELIVANKKLKSRQMDHDQRINGSAAIVNADYGVLEHSEQVNDEEIIEDAVENAHLAWIPTSPEAKKFVERKRKETGNSILKNDEDLPLLQHVMVTLSFLGSAFAVAVFADNIGEVNSIISSTMLPITCYIFPWMCTLKTPGASIRMKVLTGIMSLFSVFNAVMFFYDLITKQ